MPQIRPITRAGIDEASAVLARAFQDNPLFQGILGFMTTEARHAAVRRVKKGFTEAAVRHQHAEALYVDQKMVAASLYCTPDEYPLSLGAKFWLGTGCLTTGFRGLRNFLRMDSYVAPRHPKEPHFYLFVLGVDPPFQGRGYGKALLHALNERADAAGVPCCLETDKETSVRLYRSVGYEVVEEFAIPELGGLRTWTMLRAPRDAKAHTG